MAVVSLANNKSLIEYVVGTNYSQNYILRHFSAIYWLIQRRSHYQRRFQSVNVSDTRLQHEGMFKNFFLCISAYD